MTIPESVNSNVLNDQSVAVGTNHDSEVVFNFDFDKLQVDGLTYTEGYVDATKLDPNNKVAINLVSQQSQERIMSAAKAGAKVVGHLQPRQLASGGIVLLNLIYFGASKAFENVQKKVAAYSLFTENSRNEMREDAVADLLKKEQFKDIAVDRTLDEKQRIQSIVKRLEENNKMQWSDYIMKANNRVRSILNPNLNSQEYSTLATYLKSDEAEIFKVQRNVYRCIDCFEDTIQNQAYQTFYGNKTATTMEESIKEDPFRIITIYHDIDHDLCFDILKLGERVMNFKKGYLAQGIAPQNIPPMPNPFKNSNLLPAFDYNTMLYIEEWFAAYVHLKTKVKLNQNELDMLITMGREMYDHNLVDLSDNMKEIIKAKDSNSYWEMMKNGAKWIMEKTANTFRSLLYYIFNPVVISALNVLKYIIEQMCCIIPSALALADSAKKADADMAQIQNAHFMSRLYSSALTMIFDLTSWIGDVIVNIISTIYNSILATLNPFGPLMSLISGQTSTEAQTTETAETYWVISIFSAIINVIGKCLNLIFLCLSAVTALSFTKYKLGEIMTLVNELIQKNWSVALTSYFWMSFATIGTPLVMMIMKYIITFSWAFQIISFIGQTISFVQGAMGLIESMTGLSALFLLAPRLLFDLGPRFVNYISNKLGKGNDYFSRKSLRIFEIFGSWLSNILNVYRIYNAITGIFLSLMGIGSASSCLPSM